MRIRQTETPSAEQCAEQRAERRAAIAAAKIGVHRIRMRPDAEPTEHRVVAVRGDYATMATADGKRWTANATTTAAILLGMRR